MINANDMVNSHMLFKQKNEYKFKTILTKNLDDIQRNILSKKGTRFTGIEYEIECDDKDISLDELALFIKRELVSFGYKVHSATNYPYFFLIYWSDSLESAKFDRNVPHCYQD